MPTRDALQSFWADWKELTPEQQREFLAAVRDFVSDLRARSGFRRRLRVKGVRGARGVFELTWAKDGRATFQYGKAIRGDEPHIIWRRIGTHDILRSP